MGEEKHSCRSSLLPVVAKPATVAKARVSTPLPNLSLPFLLPPSFNLLQAEAPPQPGAGEPHTNKPGGGAAGMTLPKRTPPAFPQISPPLEGVSPSEEGKGSAAPRGARTPVSGGERVRDTPFSPPRRPLRGPELAAALPPSRLNPPHQQQPPFPTRVTRPRCSPQPPPPCFLLSSPRRFFPQRSLVCSRGRPVRDQSRGPGGGGTERREKPRQARGVKWRLASGCAASTAVLVPHPPHLRLRSPAFLSSLLLELGLGGGVSVTRSWQAAATAQVRGGGALHPLLAPATLNPQPFWSKQRQRANHRLSPPPPPHNNLSTPPHLFSLPCQAPLRRFHSDPFAAKPRDHLPRSPVIKQPPPQAAKAPHPPLPPPAATIA
ncbi:basic salivary proline-rich protein 2-like [Monodelphis domestica]|uniref:basic salivary proline-rich protein 2-like n=1 Tax=Monodelphis domestica TaxID=13616 RepID=UPI0024E1A477|nr:basic salivary proline-rich protein 2-like [Monodelphis domestica]